MLQKHKSTFIVKLFACMTAVLLVCGVLFTWSVERVKACAEGTTVDMSETLTMEDWGSINGETDNTFIAIKNNGSHLFAKAELCAYWNDHKELASSNLNCDIMEYIYVNGVSARELVTKNDTERVYSGATFPFNMNGVYAPIVVETVGSGTGLYIKILSSYAERDSFSVTLKAGFTLINNNNDILTLSEDVTYQATDSGFVKYEEYTLSFEGLENTISVVNGEKISAELPMIPEREGYVGAWSIDGVRITSDTLYTFGKDAQATISYGLISYSITINRVDGSQGLITFTVEDRAEKLLKIQPTPADKEYVYSFEESIPTQLELKNYTFNEVKSEAPPSTAIVSQSLTVGEAFSMNIYVAVIGEVPQMRFAMGERTVTVEGKLVDESKQKYVYTFEGIAADQLSDTFTATLFNGEEEVDSLQYSVEEYLQALSKTEINDKLKTLIADIVAYAQAAERYVGRTESGIQTVSELAPSLYTELTDSHYKKSISTSENVEAASVYVEYSGVNKIVVRFVATATENLTVTVNGEKAGYTLVEEGNTVYEVQSSPVYVNGMDNSYTFVFSIGDETVQTVRYSVKAYAHQMQNSENGVAADYAKALYNVGLSLTAYEEGGVQ